MSQENRPRRPGYAGAAVTRTVLFLALWLMISGSHPPDLPVGLATAALATWTSLGLVPPTRVRLRPGAMLRYAVNFLVQTVRSGLQVAALAFRPTLDLRPGLVRYRTRLPNDGRRHVFCALASLLPGTLPTGFDDDGTLLVHCLDLTQPVAAELAAEEALFSRMLDDE